MTLIEKSRREYHAIHWWIRTQYGKADMCENVDCLKKSNTYEWALKEGSNHARDRNCYMQLCKKCHAKYDMTEAKKARLLSVIHAPDVKKYNANKNAMRMRGVPMLKTVINKIIKTKRSKSTKFTAFGLSKNLLEWSEYLGVEYKTLWARIYYYNRDPESAFTKDLHKNRHKFTSTNQRHRD